MRYLVIGPGALGCLFASLLARGLTEEKDEVWLLDHRPERAKLVGQRGLIYEKEGQCVQVAVRTAHTADVIEYGDILIFCVKSYDLISSLIHWQPLLQEGSLAIFLQNGIGHLHIQQYTAKATPVFGTCSEGATLASDGHIRHCGSGATFLGFLNTVGDHPLTQLQKVSEHLNICGLTTTLSDNILVRLWAKLFVNTGINALTGIHRITNGQILQSEGLIKEMTAAINEACLIAQANGIVISEDPVQMAHQVCRMTSNNTSSMLQDINLMRQTEIDAINGAIVKEGKRLGIKTPVNARLAEKIKAIEKTAR